MSFITNGIKRSLHLKDEIGGKKYDPEVMSLRINHTNRSWGSDIDLLLKGYCEKLVISEPIPQKLMQYHSMTIAIVVFGVSLIIGSYLIEAGFGYYASIKFENAVNIWKSATTDPVGRLSMQLDYMARKIFALDTGFFRPLKSGSYALAFIISITMSIMTNSVLSEMRPSYCILTKRAEEVMRRGIASYEKNFRTFILAAISSVALAALGRFAGEILIKKFG